MGEVVFKVGDLVERFQGGGVNRPFVVGKVGFSPTRDNTACVWPVDASAYDFHYQSNIRLVERLDDQLTAAKAEVERLTALIAERDAPKVGDKFFNNSQSRDKPSTFEIILIEGSYAVCRMSNCFQPEKPQVYPLSLFKERHISKVRP